MSKKKSITFRVSDEMMEEIVSKSSVQKLTISKWIENLINKEFKSTSVDKVNTESNSYGGLFIGFLFMSIIFWVVNLLSGPTKNN